MEGGAAEQSQQRKILIVVGLCLLYYFEVRISVRVNKYPIVRNWSKGHLGLVRYVERMLLSKRKRSLDEGSQRVMKLVRESLDSGVSEAKDVKRRKSLESASSRVNMESFIKGIRDPLILDPGYPVGFDEYEAMKSDPRQNMIREIQHTPWSVEDFKSRLATFDLRHWSQKPDCIASFHCARFGWQLCTGGDALICVTCKQVIQVSGDSKVYGSPTSAFKCEVQLRKAIEANCHAALCPWKKYYSPVTILSLPQGFDMFSYLKNGVASFRESFTYPAMSSHYSQIMENMDWTWMEVIVGKKELKVEKRDVVDTEGVLPYKQSQLIYFLVLNGWSLNASEVEDCVGCYLCLRQVPLWLRRYSDLKDENNASGRSPDGPIIREGKKGRMELDPVNNHWWWCPWRRFLEFTDAATIVSSSGVKVLSGTNFFEERFEDSSCLRARAGEDDYRRLKQLIQQECAQAASITELKVISSQVVSTVGNIMDDFVSPSRRPALRCGSDEVSVVPLNDSTNGEALTDSVFKFEPSTDSNFKYEPLSDSILKYEPLNDSTCRDEDSDTQLEKSDAVSGSPIEYMNAGANWNNWRMETSNEEEEDMIKMNFKQIAHNLPPPSPPSNTNASPDNFSKPPNNPPTYSSKTTLPKRHPPSRYRAPRSGNYRSLPCKPYLRPHNTYPHPYNTNRPRSRIPSLMDIPIDPPPGLRSPRPWPILAPGLSSCSSTLPVEIPASRKRCRSPYGRRNSPAVPLIPPAPVRVEEGRVMKRNGSCNMPQKSSINCNTVLNPSSRPVPLLEFTAPTNLEVHPQRIKRTSLADFDNVQFNCDRSGRRSRSRSSSRCCPNCNGTGSATSGKEYLRGYDGGPRRGSDEDEDHRASGPFAYHPLNPQSF